METKITKRQDGELRADGALVISSIEKPNGWQEIHREALVRIRGEKEPRRIKYADSRERAEKFAKSLITWPGVKITIKEA